MTNTMLTTPAKNGLAVAALVLGIVALAGAFLPVLNVVMVPVALVGTVLATIALVKSNRLGAGKGQALTGLVLSVLALIAVPASNALFFSATESVVESIEEDPFLKEYDLEADPASLYPNGKLGDDDQSGKFEEAEVESRKGREGYLKDNDLDANGIVTYYESDKAWYDLSNTDF